MRLSTLFGRTLREAPAEVDYPALRLALRAGLVRQFLAGGYALLPLGLRAARRIEAIIRDELDGIGAQELRSPILQPADLWRASGRYDQYGPLMLRLRDNAGRELVVAPTHEEAFTELARREIASYRQLPVLAYQIAFKARDELRARAGLVRLREFTMMDCYSFDADQEGLAASYEHMRRLYERVLQRLQLDALAVEAATGQMGGSDSVEFIVASSYGEDLLLRCAGCGYAANSEVALAARSPVEQRAAAPLEKVATPNCKTIAELARFLNVGESATAKAVFFWSAERGLIFAVIRGDLEISSVKLAAALGVEQLRPATVEEIGAVGAVPGYASPVGLRDVLVVADASVVEGGPLIAGANREGYHLTGATYSRDWEASLVTDLAEVSEGDPCARCGHPLSAMRGIEVGHIFKLGTRYSKPLNATYLDQQGREQPLHMGSYGLGIERLLSVIIEQHHDDAGIVWPHSVAPAAVHLVLLGKGAEVRTAADGLYDQLRREGITVLYDDREETAGVKFNDADLIGLPLRVLLSERLLREGAVELKRRAAADILKIEHNAAAIAIGRALESAKHEPAHMGARPNA